MGRDQIKHYGTARQLAVFPFWAFLICLISSGAGYAADATNAKTDLVAFFKQVINSPPDVEKCVVKRTNLRPLPAFIKEVSLSSNSVQYFEGSLSKSNFLLYYIPDPDQPADASRQPTIAGRSGAAAYEIGGHGVMHGNGENAFSMGIQANFSLTRQLLCMGVGEIAQGTIKWNGNAFVAKNLNDRDLHGVLEVSNNLPFNLQVGFANEPLPYEAITYTYPIPADAFAGYPAKFLINYKSKNGLAPLAEVEFKSVRLATQPLNPQFFSETRFADQITYTNVYSNADFYGYNIATGKLIKDNSYTTTGGGAKPTR